MYVCKNCGQTYSEYVSFCSKCGNNYLDRVAERRNGGIYINQNPGGFVNTGYTPAPPPVPAYRATPPTPAYGYVAPPTRREGKAQGIVGMCFGIESIIFAAIMLLYSAMLAGYNSSLATSLFVIDVIPLVTGIVATSLSNVAMNKGFVSGISKAGKVTGILSIVFSAIAMFCCLVCM